MAAIERQRDRDAASKERIGREENGEVRARQVSQGVQQVCQRFYAPPERDHGDITVVLLL